MVPVETSKEPAVKDVGLPRELIGDQLREARLKEERISVQGQLLKWHKALKTQPLTDSTYPAIAPIDGPVELWTRESFVDAVVKGYVREAAAFEKQHLVEFYIARQRALPPSFHGMVDMMDVSNTSYCVLG